MLKHKKDSSPLHTACQEGNIENVERLLEIRADVNLSDENGLTPLHIACKRGYIHILRILLDTINNVTGQMQKADVNICSNEGLSPLFIASFDGNVEMVQCLLAAGADSNLREGLSPLCIACLRNQDNVVKLLLENKADVNLCSNDGHSPLYAACSAGHVEIVQRLLEAGADVNLGEKHKISPLSVACMNNQSKIVKILLKKKADVNLCNNNGNGPLISVCANGNVEILECLLVSGADVNLCNKEGLSPLHYACMQNQGKAVKILLENKANVNSCSDSGFSPLHKACVLGHLEIVKLLLEMGADINLCNANGFSFVHCRSNNKGSSPLYIACIFGNEEIVQHLLKAGADNNLCTNDGVSPLYIACQFGRLEIVKLLLEMGADINLCTEDGFSPLIIACRQNQGKVVQLLLAKKANVNSCTNKGFSPLYIACAFGNDEIVQHLLEAGADVNLCTNDGVSPLYIACEKGQVGIVQQLLHREPTGETYRIEPITSEKLKDMFNSFNVEFPDDPLRESFVREILEDEILQELVETIHFLSNGIVLTTDIHKRKEKSFVEVIVFEIDVGNDADQFKKDESPDKLKKFLNWEENNQTRIILITSKDISIVQAKLIVLERFENVIKEKNIFLQHVFDDFDEAAKLVACQRLSSFSTFVKLVLRCFTTDLYEIITKYTDEMLTPEKIKQLCLKVFGDVKHMGNESNWGQWVADFIYKKISGREELVCADAWDEISTICLKTVEDLNIILMKLDEFQTNILPIDQNKQIEEWHKRKVIRDNEKLRKLPSVIKYIAGRRDENKEVVKVYLSEDNEDAKNDFVGCCNVSKDTIFEFVNVEKWKQSQIIDEIKKTERKPCSADNSKRRKELLQIIRKNRKKIFSRHSNLIGIRIGNVMQKCGSTSIQEKTCIILYCLDKTLIPFGEKPLPDSIEGWPCAVKEDFFMLGICPENCPSTNKDFPELGCSIGIHSDHGSGSVGFLYESRKYGSGFLTASHVAIRNCHELHVDNMLLSNHPLGKKTHLIVHPSWSDNKKRSRIVGEVVESFFGEYKLSEELYEGLDFAAVKTNRCIEGDKDALDVINTDDLTYTEMVTKTGRATGTTYGYLDEDVMFAKIEYPPLSGTMNDFPELYIVKDIPETPPFFRKGDSGSGVFVMGNQDKPLGIGIAISEQSSETYVCKINEIVNRLGLTIVKYRE